MATATMKEVQDYCEREDVDDFRLVNTRTGEIIMGDVVIPAGTYKYEFMYDAWIDDEWLTHDWMEGDYEITLDGQGKIIDHLDEMVGLALNRINELMEEEANKPFNIWTWLKKKIRR